MSRQGISAQSISTLNNESPDSGQYTSSTPGLRAIFPIISRCMTAFLLGYLVGSGQMSEVLSHL